MEAGLRFNILWAGCYSGRLLRPHLLKAVVSILNNIIPADSPRAYDMANWSAYQKYAPLILGVTEAMADLRDKHSTPPHMPLGFAKILAAIGPFLYYTGKIDACRKIMFEATTIVSMELNQNPHSPQLKVLLGALFVLTGMIADRTGVSLCRESLEYQLYLVEQRKPEPASFAAHRSTSTQMELPFTKPDSEIRLFIAESDLAGAYLQRADFAKARVIMDELYTICRTKSVPEDEYRHEWSRYHHHMAFVLMAEGGKEKAIEYISMARDLDTLLAGAEHPIVLSDGYDLANMMLYAGREHEALEEHKEVMRLLEAMCKCPRENALDEGQGDDDTGMCNCQNQYDLESVEAVFILLHLAGRDAEIEQKWGPIVDSEDDYDWDEEYWSFEGVARTQYWVLRLLAAIGEDGDARDCLFEAEDRKGDCLKWFSDLLEEGPENPAAMYDRMLSIWVMQTTRFLVDGGRGKGGEKVGERLKADDDEKRLYEEKVDEEGKLYGKENVDEEEKTYECGLITSL